MRKRKLILAVLALLFVMSTASIFAQDAGGTTCVVSVNDGGPVNKPSPVLYIDYGNGKIETVKPVSLAKFVDEMKVKGWSLMQTGTDGKYLYLFFDKKK
jgi:hypothetical protein